MPTDAGNVAGFWTLDRRTITGRSAVILRQHTTPFRPMIVAFDDLELVHQSLRMLEPLHRHKFPRVDAQDSKLGPIQPWDVKDFLRPGRGRALWLGCALRERIRRFPDIHVQAPGTTACNRK